MSLKIARMCTIYGTGVAISLAIVNFIYPDSFDWNIIIIFLVVSLGLYYYLEHRVIPQVEKHRAAMAAEAARNADPTEEAGKPQQRAVTQRRKRPKLRK